MAAALSAGVSVRYSEDMQHELTIEEQLQICSPFIQRQGSLFRLPNSVVYFFIQERAAAHQRLRPTVFGAGMPGESCQQSLWLA